jgi:hypothetical protein
LYPIFNVKSCMAVAFSKESIRNFDQVRFCGYVTAILAKLRKMMTEISPRENADAAARVQLIEGSPPGWGR